jgi:hypothetical protein
MSMPDKDSLQAGRILLSRASPTTQFNGNREAIPKTIITAMLRESNNLSLPKRSFEEAVGDAMSVNVLQTMLRRLVHSAGLAILTPSHDWWLLCPSDRCYQLSDNLWAKHTEKNIT